MLSVESPDQLTYKNNIPFVVWCYWEGPLMTNNRLLSFNLLKENIGVPVCLITPENINKFLIKGAPLPTTYSKLSVVHRSDYIRAYLLHHYGGAWHDIKATEVSYASSWDIFKDPNVWIIGRAEKQKGAAQIYTDNGIYVPQEYKKLIAVPSWIARPKTDFSKDLLLGIENILELNKEKLNKHPAKHPREKYISPRNFLHKIIIWIKHTYAGRNVNYPLEWTLFGNVFHPMLLKHQAHIDYNLPEDKNKNAGIYHRG